MCCLAIPAAARGPLLFYRSPRALGMGDAFTAVCDDKDAFFYNPAGLSNMDKGYLDLLRLNVDTNESTADAIDRFSKLNASRSAGAMLELVREFIDTDVSMGLSTGISFVRKNFGLGILAEALLVGGLNTTDPLTAGLEAAGHLNSTVIQGYSHRINNVWGKDLVAGYTLKYLQKKTFTGKAGVADPAGTVAQDLDTDGFSTDLGMLIKLEGYGDPTLGVVMSDIISAGFDDKLSDAIEPDMNIGFAMKPLPQKTRRLAGATVSVEVREVFRSGSFSKKWCAGGELTVGKFIKLRTGLHQGSPTFGLGLRLPLINFDIASYSRFVPGKATGEDDRHYVLSAKVIF